MPRKDKVTFKKATLPFPVAAAVLVSMLQCAAHAAPTISLSGIYSKADILLVAQGCGAGFHREAYGYCVPNGRVVVPPPAIAPPVVVAPRVCPPGYRLGPYGRRCLPVGAYRPLLPAYGPPPGYAPPPRGAGDPPPAENSPSGEYSPPPGTESGPPPSKE